MATCKRRYSTERDGTWIVVELVESVAGCYALGLFLSLPLEIGLG
jgi:hypothetical protein